MGVGGQRDVPAALPPGMKPGAQCTGGSVGHRAGLDRGEKFTLPPGFDYPNRSSRSELLSRLRHTGPIPVKLFCLDKKKTRFFIPHIATPYILARIIKIN
jgi:hypothetical protein